MRKFIDVILIILLFLSIYVLQSNLFTWLKIAGIMPNLFIIFIMMIGLFLKQKVGFFVGIGCGLLLDFFVGTRIGISAISLASVGLVAGILEKNFSNDSKMTIIIILSFLTFQCEAIKYLLNIIILGIKSIYIVDFFKIVLIEIIYNDLLLIILYPIFSKFGNKLEEDFMNKKFKYL